MPVTAIPYYEMYSGLGNKIRDVGAGLQSQANLAMQLQALMKQKDFVKNLEVSASAKFGKEIKFPEGTTPQVAADMVGKLGEVQQKVEQYQKLAREKYNLKGNANPIQFGSFYQDYILGGGDYKEALKKIDETYNIWEGAEGVPAVEKELSNVGIEAKPQVGGPLRQEPSQPSIMQDIGLGALKAPATPGEQYQPITPATPSWEQKQVEMAQRGFKPEEIAATKEGKRLIEEETAQRTLSQLGDIDSKQSKIENFIAAIKANKGKPLSPDIIKTIQSYENPEDKALLWARLKWGMDNKSMSVPEMYKMLPAMKSGLIRDIEKRNTWQAKIEANSFTDATEKDQIEVDLPLLEQSIKDQQKQLKEAYLFINNPKSLGYSPSLSEAIGGAEKQAGEEQKVKTEQSIIGHEKDLSEILGRLKSDYPKGLERFGPDYTPAAVKKTIQKYIPNYINLKDSEVDFIYDQFISQMGGGDTTTNTITPEDQSAIDLIKANPQSPSYLKAKAKYDAKYPGIITW